MNLVGIFRQGVFSAFALTGAGLFATPALAQGDTATISEPTLSKSELILTPSNVQFVDDADDAASDWVANHSDRVAVSIRLGGATTFTPEFIQEQIQQALADNGVTNAVFFWEHGLEDGGTSVAVETDDMTFGPFGLDGELLTRHIPDIASQIRFNGEITVAPNVNDYN